MLRVEAAKMRYNSDAVTGTDKGMTIKHQMPSDEDFVLVFEIAMSGDVKDRLVIGNGTRAEFGDRQVHAGDAQVYDVTVSANDMGNGVTAIEYIGRAAGCQRERRRHRGPARQGRRPGQRRRERRNRRRGSGRRMTVLPASRFERLPTTREPFSSFNRGSRFH